MTVLDNYYEQARYRLNPEPKREYARNYYRANRANVLAQKAEKRREAGMKERKFK